MPKTVETTGSSVVRGAGAVNMYARLFAPSLAWEGSSSGFKDITGLELHEINDEGETVTLHESGIGGEIHTWGAEAWQSTSCIWIRSFLTLALPWRVLLSFACYRRLDLTHTRICRTSRRPRILPLRACLWVACVRGPWRCSSARRRHLSVLWGVLC